MGLALANTGLSGIVDTELIPLTISNIAGMYRSDVTTEDTGGIATWPDLSANGFDLTAAEATRPGLTASNANFNGHPSLDFNGSTDWMSNDAGLPALFSGNDKPFTFFQVYRYGATNTTTEYPWSLGNSGQSGKSFHYQRISAAVPGPAKYRATRSDDDANAINASVTAGAESSDGANTARIAVDHFTGEEAKLYRNGTLLTTSAMNSPSIVTVDQFTLAASRRITVVTDSYFACPFAELIMYSRALTVAELNIVGNYLALRYNQTWNTVT